MRKICIRSFVILFWTSLIALVLYFPTDVFLKSHENSINIFAWGDILEPSVIAQFEKKTGIKVNMNYYASNEELVVKMKATKGVGYDLIVPSEYSVRLLKDENLLKKIDKGALDFYKHINPMLLGHYFDQTNDFSIPFQWEIIGLGIDKTYFKTHFFEPSWKMIFDQKIINYPIGMMNDPFQTLSIGSFYLYGDRDTISQEELDKVVELFKSQKKWVSAYADFRADYFVASKNCPIVVSLSSYIWRAMKRFDFIGFVVPKEGSFISIENIAIPKPSKKEKLVYQLINFLYSTESMETHYTTYGLFPATTDVLENGCFDPDALKILNSTPEEFKKFHFMKNIAPSGDLLDAWVRVKTHYSLFSDD